METMAAAFATSAVAGGTAAGGGAAAGGLFAGLGLFDVLAGGFTVAQGLLQFQAGRQEAAALESQALFEDFNARQEVLKGKAAVIEELERLNDVLAANVVAGFASGLQPSGSVGQASLDAIEDANFRMDLSRSNAAIAAGGRRGEASVKRQDASSAKTAGIVGAVGSGVSLFDRLARRGV